MRYIKTGIDTDKSTATHRWKNCTYLYKFDSEGNPMVFSEYHNYWVYSDYKKNNLFLQNNLEKIK